MKKGSKCLIPSPDSNDDNNENDNLENSEQKLNDVKDNNNNNSVYDSISASENMNKEQMEQSDLNNFDIEFFLPNDLQEELNLSKNLNKEQEDNTIGKNNFNNIFIDEKINIKKEKEKDNNIDKS